MQLQASQPEVFHSTVVAVQYKCGTSIFTLRFDDRNMDDLHKPICQAIGRVIDGYFTCECYGGGGGGKITDELKIIWYRMVVSQGEKV